MSSLKIDHLSHHRLTKLAHALGKSVSELAEEAINEWMDTNGEPILKGIERRRKQAEEAKRTVIKKAGRLLEFSATQTNRRISKDKAKVSDD